MVLRDSISRKSPEVVWILESGYLFLFSRGIEVAGNSLNKSFFVWFGKACDYAHALPALQLRPLITCSFFAAWAALKTSEWSSIYQRWWMMCSILRWLQGALSLKQCNHLYVSSDIAPGRTVGRRTIFSLRARSTRAARTKQRALLWSANMCMSRLTTRTWT